MSRGGGRDRAAMMAFLHEHVDVAAERGDGLRRVQDEFGLATVEVAELLWDALGSEFGSRHLQYEMFYAGEPAAIQGREFRSFDWAAAETLVDRCLASYDEESA